MAELLGKMICDITDKKISDSYLRAFFQYILLYKKLSELYPIQINEFFNDDYILRNKIDSTINDLMMGSFLAPEAQVYLQGGPFNGSIFCKDFLGNNNEVHKVDFEVEGVPKPEEPKEEIEEIKITLTPGTGDISVYGDLYYPVFALAILVSINKKNNKN